MPELGKEKVETMFYRISSKVLETMFYRINSKVRTASSPEFLFRIAAKINVAYWATVNILIIDFIHNAIPANCQRYRKQEKL